MTAYQVGCFGKLPFHGDFLRHVPSLVPVERVDAWFQAGNLAHDRLEAFEASSAVFAMFPDREHWWGLAIFPSQDHVGRRYPFVLCAQAPQALIGDEIALVPSLFAPFFQAAFLASTRGWPQDQDSLAAVLAGLAGQFDAARSAQTTANALASLHASDLWRALLGDAAGSRRARVVEQVIERASQSRIAWGLRIQPSVHQSHVSFWLWLISLVRERSSPPSLITMHPPQTPFPPSSYLLWDNVAPETAFAALWPRCALSSFVGQLADLATVEEPSSSSAVVSEDLAPLLEDADLSLRDLLHGLSSWWRNARLRSRHNAWR